MTTTETFVLDLDPKVPLADRIRAGKYYYVDPAITPEHFTLTLSGKREVILFDPHGAVSSEEMIRRMKADHCVPATLDDCLVMGRQFPDRQCINPIVFLGMVWRGPGGYRHVPVLDDWFGGRGLYLYWFDDDWHDFYRFAAVRES